MLNFKSSRWPLFVTALLLIAICSYVPAGIIQAVIPQAAPTANKRGNSTVFQLAADNSSGTRGQLLCVDSNGNASVTNCFVPPGQLTYYFSDTASDISTYLQATTAPYSPKTQLNFAVANGTNTVQNWATVPGQPGLTLIPAGVYSFHVHASKAAGANVSIQTQFVEVNAAGADIGVIGTSDATGNLATTEAEFDQAFVDANTYTLASSTSRIVARVQSVVSGGPGTAHIFVGGTADTHISIPNPGGGGGGGGAGAPGATLFSSTTQHGPNDTAAETSLVGSVVGSQTVSANTFVNGQVLEARAQGYFSLPAVADALTLKAKCGSTVLASASFTPPAGVVTNGTFRLWLMFTAIGSGAGGAIMTNGHVELVGTTLSPTVSKVLNTSNVAYDFTTSCAFDVTAQWGGAQVGETIQGTNAAAWIPGAPVTSVQSLTGAVTITDANLSVSNVTTNDVSVTAHGFAPKAPNDATKFLNGVGAYTVPAGGGGGLTQIGQVTTAGSATTVTFLAIAGTYTNLVVTYSARSAQATNTSAIRLAVNGDATSGDYSTVLYILSPALTSFTVASTSAGLFVANIPGASTTAGYPGTGKIYLESYSGTIFDKRVRCEGAFATISSESLIFTTGTWLSTAAITSLIFSLDSGPAFVDGSVFTLYGQQ